MQNRIAFILKNIIVYIITLVCFALATKVIHGAGNMPRFMINAYDSSIFIKTNTKTLAIVGLCTLIITFLLINYHMINKGIHHNNILRGIIFGGAFGITWFFGFTEMNTINNDNVPSHLISGVRDLLILSIFGLCAGLLFSKSNNSKIRRNPNSLLAIPLIAVFFALSHGMQLYFTFNEVSAYQKIDSVVDVIWLLGFGTWVGFMYYIFSPGIKTKNLIYHAFFFSYFIFGTDWILFNLFYNIFLDIPLIDLFLRCLSGCTGCFIGLCIYYKCLLTKSDYDSTNDYL